MRSTKSPSWIERLLGLSPRPVPPHVFEIDEKGLHFGRFQVAEGGIRFLEYREIGLPANSFQSGVLGGPLRDTAGFAELLDRLIEEIAVGLHEATLVLPDRWFRVVFLELEELPKASDAREAILRWKLKRLVPFRVEELRIRGQVVEPLPRQEEKSRILLGYALDRLLEQLEEAFAQRGIHLGYLANRSLSLLAGLASSFGEDEISALGVVRDGSYTLTFAQGASPLLLRFKEQRGADVALEGNLVSRDLRLTRSFLRQQFPALPLGKVLLAAPVDMAPEWLAWLSDGLGRQAEPLRADHLPLIGEVETGPWWRRWR